MSYPDPNNPYGGQPQGQPYGGQPQGQPQGQPYGGQPQGQPYGGQPQGQPYGYPQQQQPSPPGYAYPQGHQGAPYAAYPGGVPGVPGSMPGQVVAARVLLFIAGALWAFTAVIVLIFGISAGNMGDDLPVSDFGRVAAGAAIILFLVFGGLAALHLTPASMFGKGRGGTRITAIIAASVNSLISVLAFLSAVANGGNPVLALLWAATAIVTLVFCCLRQAGEWFNRPQY
ncbi:hypothetical protein [Streptomyces sp. NPDC048639]|uniref:hypothetical protein n=1 Tax=Streptomyces sp. NPDC048639 TaxID=3365581 RepID=UPI0037135A08